MADNYLNYIGDILAGKTMSELKVKYPEITKDQKTYSQWGSDYDKVNGITPKPSTTPKSNSTYTNNWIPKKDYDYANGVPTSALPVPPAPRPPVEVTGSMSLMQEVPKESSLISSIRRSWSDNGLDPNIPINQGIANNPVPVKPQQVANNVQQETQAPTKRAFDTYDSSFKQLKAELDKENPYGTLRWEGNTLTNLASGYKRTPDGHIAPETYKGIDKYIENKAIYDKAKGEYDILNKKNIENSMDAEKKAIEAQAKKNEHVYGDWIVNLDKGFSFNTKTGEMKGVPKKEDATHGKPLLQQQGKDKQNALSGLRAIAELKSLINDLSKKGQSYEAINPLNFELQKKIKALTSEIGDPKTRFRTGAALNKMEEKVYGDYQGITPKDFILSPKSSIDNLDILERYYNDIYGMYGGEEGDFYKGVASTNSQSMNNSVSQGRIKVKSPDGRIGHIPESQLQEALSSGYMEVQ